MWETEYPQECEEDMSGRRPMTVTEVNASIKNVLETSHRDIWVEGELSSITLHPSGHVYFSLKDNRCQIRGIAWSYVRRAQMLGLAIGMRVEVTASVTVYEPRGEYQLSARSIIPMGEGDLHRRYLELRSRLQAEGLFDGSRKRPLPYLPKCIGLLTAETGAAYRDFIENIHRRFGGLHVLFYPVLVQGNDAVQSILRGLDYLNRDGRSEVIVLTRGGGASEDLFIFNDERLVRAVAVSAIPVISAVGHQRDESLCDLAADFACATPTHAAQVVVFGRDEVTKRLESGYQRALQAMKLQLAGKRQRFLSVWNRLQMQEPHRRLNDLRQRLEYGRMRLDAVLVRLAERCRMRLNQSENKLAVCRRAMIDIRKQRLVRLDGVLAALNPKNVLGRGYSILLNAAGQAVSEAVKMQVGEELRGILHTGEIAVTVKEINTGE